MCEVILKQKRDWLCMRAAMIAGRPPDTATPGDAYETWYRDYCATDKDDPLPCTTSARHAALTRL